MTGISDDLKARCDLLIADLETTLGGDHSARVYAHALRLQSMSVSRAPDKLVEDVQQQVHDEHLSSTWPTCPRHGSHPLWLQGDRWACERDNVPVVSVGHLAEAWRLHHEKP